MQCWCSHSYHVWDDIPVPQISTWCVHIRFSHEHKDQKSSWTCTHQSQLTQTTQTLWFKRRAAAKDKLTLSYTKVYRSASIAVLETAKSTIFARIHYFFNPVDIWVQRTKHDYQLKRLVKRKKPRGQKKIEGFTSTCKRAGVATQWENFDLCIGYWINIGSSRSFLTLFFTGKRHKNSSTSLSSILNPWYIYVQHAGKTANQLQYKDRADNRRTK